MKETDDHLAWPDRFEQVIEQLEVFDRVVVLSETDSTQDAARRESSSTGSVILTGRQVAGRGRQGRAWDDAMGDGVAMTLVVPLEDPAYLCARAAITLARALVPWLEQKRIHAGLKWPNDLVMVSTGLRKVAGILVEGHEGNALIGIGINVHTRDWPLELSDSAGSLEEVGLKVTRMDVIERILVEWNAVCALNQDALGSAYAQHDLLTGASAVIEEGENLFKGMIRSVDPFKGIELETTKGLRQIDPQCAHVIEWQLPDRLKRGR